MPGGTATATRCSLVEGHHGDHVNLFRDGCHAQWADGEVPVLYGPGEVRGQPRRMTATAGEVDRMAKGDSAKRGLLGLTTAMQRNARERQVRSYGAKRLGFAGVACSECGSMQTVRIGKCVRCTSCGHDGECG